MIAENLKTEHFIDIPDEVEVVDGAFRIKRKAEDIKIISTGLNSYVYISRRFSDITDKLQNIGIIPALNMLLLNKTIVQFLPRLSKQSIIIEVSGFPQSDDENISYEFNQLDMGLDINVTNNSFDVYIWDANLGQYYKVCSNISDISSMVIDLKAHTMSINSTKYSIPTNIIDDALYINLVTTESNLFSWASISLEAKLTYAEKRYGFLVADSAELLTKEMFNGSQIDNKSPKPEELWKLYGISMEVDTDVVLPRVFIRYGPQFNSLEKEEWFEAFPQRDLNTPDRLAYIYPLSTFEFTSEYYSVEDVSTGAQRIISKKYSGKMQLRIIIPKIDDKTSMSVSNLKLWLNE